MSAVTITHTPAEGTLVLGDPRPHHQLVKDAGFKWSRREGFWYKPHSRDSRLSGHEQDRLTRLADALKAVGLDVTVTVDNDGPRRSTAEQVADDIERAERRSEAYADKAVRRHVESNGLSERAHAKAEMVPFGQPILVGHHSEKTHRSHLKKLHGLQDKAVETWREANEYERRAEAAERTMAHRLTAPATQRRIKKLEAEERKAVKMTIRCKASSKTVPSGWMYEGRAECPFCRRSKMTPNDGRYPEHTPGDVERWTHILEDVTEKLAYWREHLAKLQGEGVKVWGPDDFKKGNLAFCWGQWRKVVRVNKKSLSVESGYSWTNTIPYDQVSGQRPAEMEETG